jgi:hypothetical protein
MKIIKEKICFVFLILGILLISNVLCKSSFELNVKKDLSNANLKHKYTNKISKIGIILYL